MFERLPVTGKGMQFGRLLTADQLSAEEKKFLQDAGCEDVKVVPENLADIIANIRADVRNPTALPVPPDTPPLDIDKIDREMKQFNTLSEQEKLDIQAVMAEAAKIAKNQDIKRAAILPGMDPSVAAAIEQMVDSDDSPESSTKPAEQPADPPPGSHGAGGGLVFCPMCNHKLDQPVVVEPTEDEMRAFVEATVSSTRFTQDYKLLGGAITLTLHEPMQRENDMIAAEIRRQLKSGELSTVPDPFAPYAVQFELRAFLSLKAITYASGQLGMVLVTPLSDWLKGPGDRPFSGYIEYLKYDVLKTSSLIGMLLTNYRRFNILREFLEARSHDPDFYKALATGQD